MSEGGFFLSGARANSVLIESKPGSNSLFDAFSSREPVPTSLENAMHRAVSFKAFLFGVLFDAAAVQVGFDL